MNSPDAEPTQRRLPPPSRRLFLLYRILWCMLALGSFLAVGVSCFQSAAHPAVLGLRLMKSAVLVCVATILLYRRQSDPVAALLALAFLTWTISSNFDFGTSSAFAQLLDRFRFLLFALTLLLFPDA